MKPFEPIHAIYGVVNHWSEEKYQLLQLEITNSAVKVSDFSRFGGKNHEGKKFWETFFGESVAQNVLDLNKKIIPLGFMDAEI